jgi:arylsulfatase A-like enzyme
VQEVCSPTRSALMTGRYPFHTGFQHVVMPGATGKLPLDISTLPEALAKVGYRRHMIGSCITSRAASRDSHHHQPRQVNGTWGTARGSTLHLAGVSSRSVATYSDSLITTSTRDQILATPIRKIPAGSTFGATKQRHGIR